MPQICSFPLCLFVLLLSNHAGRIRVGAAAAKDRGLFLIIGLSTIVVFALSYALKGPGTYEYVSATSLR